MGRRWLLVVLALLAPLGTGCEPRGTRPRPPVAGLPASMAALGDSITTGFGSCIFLDSCARNSWSSGDGLRVKSHLRRIAESNKAIRGNGHNLAVERARAAGLPAQAEAAVKLKVEYVTVLIGANDVCHAGADQMTSPAAFRKEIDRALAVLGKGLPEARLLVASVPDLYRLWELGHTNSAAIRAWSRGICPALLANPTSTAEADAARRAAVRARVDAYNRELAGACRAYGPRCRYDGGAVHDAGFTLNMLNVLDYFHPDADGQSRLAEVTFPESFSW
jgi:lysophospholipase L1-like esterase